MAKLKTAPNDKSVTAFLEQVPDDTKRGDAETLLNLMEEITGSAPVMWGDSIVGFGTCKLHYKSGRELEWFLTGFSPRKTALTLYLMGGLEQQADLLEQLGPYKRGKGCLYIKRLAQVDMSILRQMIERGVRALQDQE